MTYMTTYSDTVTFHSSPLSFCQQYGTNICPKVKHNAKYCIVLDNEQKVPLFSVLEFL